MNKVNSTIFGLAFIVLLCGAASATQINVNQTGWWNAGDTTFHAINPGQIQAAIDNATAGDTIYVYNGSYNENVDVDKRLTLEGEGADMVTVTAETSADYVFYVTANYVNITGFKVTGATGTTTYIQGGFAGFFLNCAYHCNISDNIVSGNYNGIYLQASGSNMLTGNDCSNNDNDGIAMYYESKYNMLTGNDCSNNDNDGIYMYDVQHNTLTGNDCSNNGNRGIFLKILTTNNMLTGNDCSNNQWGIYLTHSCDNNISCNWVQNNAVAGFYLEGYPNYGDSTGNTIENNNIIANGVYNDTSGGYEWQFKNNQSSDVNTANNWWGTNNETRIDASIYDQTYHASYGKVITSPRLDGPAPCAPVPELPTIALLAVGLLMLAGYVRIERKKDE